MPRNCGVPKITELVMAKPGCQPMKLHLYQPFWSRVYLKHFFQIFRWVVCDVSHICFPLGIWSWSTSPHLTSSLPDLHLRRTTTVAGPVLGAHALFHRHPAVLLAAAAGGAGGHPLTPQPGSPQFAAAPPAVPERALTYGPFQTHP